MLAEDVRRISRDERAARSSSWATCASPAATMPSASSTPCGLQRPGHHRAVLAGLARVPGRRWRMRCRTSPWKCRWRAMTRSCATRSASTTATSRWSARCTTRSTWARSGWTSSSCPACPSRPPRRCLETIDYCEDLLKRFGKDGRLAPFISPLAPFLDPGSRGFEDPEEHGYQLFARTLEEHRRLLVAPSWKYVLNYETQWMDRAPARGRDLRGRQAAESDQGRVRAGARRRRPRRPSSASTGPWRSSPRSTS